MKKPIPDLDPTLRMLGLDVVLIQVHHAKALERMGEASAGFPTGLDAPGDGDGGSITERLALAPPDQAQADLKRMRILLAAASINAHDLAELLRSWANGTVGGVKAKGKNDDDVWCPNCQTHGHAEPKGENRRHCEWCTDVQIAWGVLPNAELYRMRSYKQRLTEVDYTRALKASKRKNAA